jgi:hypothetical protein
MAPNHGPIRTRVHNVKAPTQQHTHARSKNREITVKINDNNPSSQARRATREQIIEQVNQAIRASGDLGNQIQVRAAKRYPSGDLTSARNTQTSSSNTGQLGKAQ